MSTKLDSSSSALAERLLFERNQRGWTLSDLAKQSGVSKAMISKIERNETSPTAALLGKLSGAFGLTLSTLLNRSEGFKNRLNRQEDQTVWQDPKTGYLRRQIVAPPDMPFELVEVELPAGASVPFPASAYAFLQQVIWVTFGNLTFVQGDKRHILSQGDCLQLGPPLDCVYRNETKKPARYLVALMRI
jgi:transcriptional regulator with XRE-family HTH domain